MAYQYEDKLRERAKPFLASLEQDGFDARITMVRDYMLKIALSRNGRSLGHVSLYYKPSADAFNLKGHELREASVLSELKDLFYERSADELAGHHIYVDGSYLSHHIGYGMVVLREGTQVDERCGCADDEEAQQMRNVVGELHATREALRWCEEQGVEQVTLHYDYKGVKQWATGGWQARNALTQAYADFMREGPLQITWRKVEAHTGNRWNEKADELAKRGARSCND